MRQKFTLNLSHQRRPLAFLGCIILCLQYCCPLLPLGKISSFLFSLNQHVHASSWTGGDDKLAAGRVVVQGDESQLLHKALLGCQ